MSPGRFQRFAEESKRFNEIIKILSKYKLADWVKDSAPQHLKDKFKTAGGDDILPYTHEERIRMAITELGTTFIKFGQVLSTRADLVGPELAEELSMLQANTPADPPEVARATVEAELGKPVEEIYAEFEPEAMASASIGQVHAARLKDGTEVVVKVQHAGIEETITTDLDIFDVLAAIAERASEELRRYRPRTLVAEFRKQLLSELNFNREKTNAQRFIHNFEYDDTVHFPEPYPELTTKRVLTMERVKGFSVRDSKKVDESGVDRRDLSLRIANLYMDMIFRDRFYHGDPHPGNVFVLPGAVVGLLDFGVVGRIDEELQERLEGLILALVGRDARSLTDEVLRLGEPPQDLDRVEFQSAIVDFVGEYIDVPVKEMDISGILTTLAGIIRRFHIGIPGGVSLLIKVLVQLEGTSRLLNNDFRLSEVLEPYTRKIMRRRMSPQALLRRARRSVLEWARFIDLLPRQLVQILERAEKGTLDVQLRHKGLDETVNRLIYGVLTGALILGSSQMLSSQVPPLVGGLSAPGLIGLVLAVGLTLRLLGAIKKSGGLTKRE
jgi:ubiquinone biosynthesis protein